MFDSNDARCNHEELCHQIWDNVNVTGLFPINLNSICEIMDAYLIHAVFEKVIYFFLNLDSSNYSLQVQ